MTELQLHKTPEGHVNEQEMQFWLDKAVAWGQADSPEARKDTCLHSSRLKEFLQRLLTQINDVGVPSEAMKKLPLLGQFLGRLCWNPYITAEDESRKLLFRCMWSLYSEHPHNAVERKANQWIKKVLCQLATEEEEITSQVVMRQLGVSPKEYHVKVLKKMMKRLKENIEKGCCSQTLMDKRSSHDASAEAASGSCVALVTCPEASPLIGAFLQQPERLSEDFMQALSSAHSRQVQPLQEQAVASLWCHSLPSLEDTVLTLLESVSDTMTTPQKIEQQIIDSLLPKASAQNCSIFLVINDIFRSILKQAERNQSIRFLIQTFTKCFLRELMLLQPQASTRLKDFFPQSPSSVLVPLATMPSEMPREALRNHLKWLSGSLRRLTEEEEEEEEEERGGGGDTASRGRHQVFEAWFLLLQCAHWVQVSVQLLPTSGPEDCGPLLWLLTFYHHPTNRWHHRTSHLVQARAAWEHLSALFSVTAAPLPADHLQPFIALLSQRPSLAPSAALSLLLHFAVFCQQPLSISAELLQMVADQCGLRKEAAQLLESMQTGPNDGGCLESDRVRIRITRLHDAVTNGC